MATELQDSVAAFLGQGDLPARSGETIDVEELAARPGIADQAT